MLPRVLGSSEVSQIMMSASSSSSSTSSPPSKVPVSLSIIYVTDINTSATGLLLAQLGGSEHGVGLDPAVGRGDALHLCLRRLLVLLHLLLPFPDHLGSRVILLNFLTIDTEQLAVGDTSDTWSLGHLVGPDVCVTTLLP